MNTKEYKITLQNKIINYYYEKTNLSENNIIIIDFVNYPPTPKAMGGASDFTDLRFFTEASFKSPSV